MADESQKFTAAPVELAPGIGENNEVPSTEPIRYTQQQQIDYADAQEAAKQQKQAQDQNALFNAGAPTPLGTETNPPINETLSKLGKAEPAQVGAASLAMQPQQTAPAQVQPDAASAGPQVPQQPQAPQPDGLEKSINKAYGAQEAANVSIAKATEAKAVADQAQFKVAETAIAKAELEREKTRAQFDSDYKERMNKYEQSVTDFKEAAGEKVFPGRILADMSTGQKVQSGIFMALSAYGAAISGQENQSLKVINNAIDRDIEAQKFNIENKLKAARVGVESNQYLVTQMREKFKDDESATLASKAAMLQMVQQQLNTNASKLDQATAAPKAQALNAQIEMQKQQVLQQLHQQQAQQFILNNLAGPQTNQNKPGYLSPQVLNVMKQTPGEMKDRAESYVPGYGTSSGGQKDKEKFQEELQFKEPVLEAMDRVRVLKQDFNKITDPVKRAQITSEVAGIKAKLKQGALLHTNRFQPEIIAFLDDFIGQPTSVTSIDKLQMAKFDQAYNTVQSDIDSAARLHGYDVPHRDFNSTTYNNLKAARKK